MLFYIASYSQSKGKVDCESDEVRRKQKIVILSERNHKKRLTFLPSNDIITNVQRGGIPELAKGGRL